MATEAELTEIAAECKTFEEGLQQWASGNEPMSFNRWQKGCSQIRLLFTSDAERPDPAGPNYTATISGLWKDIMLQLHGPDWKKGIPKGLTRTANPPGEGAKVSGGIGLHPAPADRPDQGGGAAALLAIEESAEAPGASAPIGSLAVVPKVVGSSQSASGRLEAQFTFEVPAPARAGGTDPGNPYGSAQPIPPVVPVRGGVPLTTTGPGPLSSGHQ